MNVAVLKKLGLTMYEAQVYVTLTSLISSTATEISEKSGIPRSKIYEVLKGLVQKEYVDVEDGRPLTYNVKMYPRFFIHKFLSFINNCIFII